MSVITMILLSVALLPPGGTFVDDDGSGHEPDIEAIAALELTSGCDAFRIRFCPGRPVTRAEMAVFVSRALGGDGGEEAQVFVDVPSRVWYASAVGHLARLGITTGCGAQRYCPDRPVSRAETATFLVRAFELPHSGRDAFADDDASDHESHINALAAAGYTKGCDVLRYCPGDSLTRAQMATLLARAHHVTGSAPPPFHAEVGMIHDPLRVRMTHSWRSGCPVGLADLRYVSIDHWGFDGAVHRGELVVHRVHAEGIVRALRSLFALEFPIEQMRLVDDFGGDDLASMEANNTSAFNCRSVTGRPGVWSEHAYGTAIDINPVQNPFVRDGVVLPESGAAYLDRSDHRPGMIRPGDGVVEEFSAIGWQWGGFWTSSKDYQHFSASGR